MRYARTQTPWRHWDVEGLHNNIGLYVHIPFCLARCPYCDYLTFSKHQQAGFDTQAYTDCLLAEISNTASLNRKGNDGLERPVDSVFIGGGTPTFLKQEQLLAIISVIQDSYRLTGNVEFTIEANPECLDAVYIQALSAAGVNRLSIGVQAVQNQHLKFLGRTHRWPQIEAALSLVKAGSIDNISLDLLYAVPGLSLTELADSLEVMQEFSPSQIAAYELTIEAGTPLAVWANRFSGRIPKPEDSVNQQRLIESRLAGAGLYRYEVCSYAKPGLECRHNLRYWIGGDYLGLGLGAASRIGKNVVSNPRDFKEYASMVNSGAGVNPALAQAMEEQHQAVGRVAADKFMQLRTRRGLSADVRIDQAWVAKGWLSYHNGRYEVTRRGLNFADLMALELLGDQDGV